MTVRAYFYLLAILLLSTGCTKNFEVEEADKMHEFYIGRPYFSFGFEYPIKLTVTCQIDGKALIYITPSATSYNPSYSMSFSPRYRKRTLAREIFFERNVIVYKPITAKKGKLNIKVEF